MWTGLPIAFSLLNPSVSLSGDELRAQIEHESGGVIFLASKEALRYSYHYQPGLRVVEPDPVLDPEVAQQFFALDTKKFILSENKDNFLDAKETYFRKLPYSFSKKQFVQSQTTLSDWGGLNHPPVRKITPQDLEWITPTTVVTPLSSERNSVPFQKKIDELSDSEITAGNQIEPYWDRDVLDQLIALVKSSQKTIYGSALLFACDPSTQDLVDALIDRAQHGVDVRLMVDKTMQSLQQGKCIKMLRAHRIKVVKVAGMLTKKSAFHIKLWVSDFKTGMLLGANLIDVQTRSTGFNHLFHDSGIVIHGPAVTDISNHFMNLWDLYSKDQSPEWTLGRAQVQSMKTSEKATHLRGTDHYATWFNPYAPRTKGLCRVVVQERHSVKDRVSQTLGAYLKTAQHHVWFNSVRRDFKNILKSRARGDNEILASLFEKSRDEGLHVEMMYNATTNPYSPYFVRSSPIGPSAKAGLLNTLMRKYLNHSTDRAIHDGSQFFKAVQAQAPHFRPWSYFTYSHVKALIMDQDFSMVGSYNPIDERSTTDAEIALFCQDEGINLGLSLGLARDLVNSIPYPLSSSN